MHDELGRVPEFTRQSRNPGIGHGYLTEERKKWHRENRALWLWQNGYKKPLPPYYHKKIWDEKELEEIKIEQSDYLDELEEAEIERLDKIGYEHPRRELRSREIKQANNRARRIHNYKRHLD